MDPLVDRLAKRLAARDVVRARKTSATTRRSLVQYGASLITGLLALPSWKADEAHAQDAEPEATRNRRVGRYSRGEGIKSWKVRGSGSIVNVDFTHKKRKLSGQVRVVYSDSGRTLTTVLSRRSGRFQFALNRGGFAAVDKEGNSATGRLTERNRRLAWDISEASEQVLRRSRDDFRLALAVAGDLAPRITRRSSLQSSEVPASSDEDERPDCLKIPDGRCSRDSYKGTTAPFARIGRDEACLVATYDMDDRCRAASGSPCCCALGCWCVCADALKKLIGGTPDFVCGCDRTGNTFPG